jgi:ABC-type glycerol-3-phosphate transport system substrate-binding protein
MKNILLLILITISISFSLGCGMGNKDAVRVLLNKPVFLPYIETFNAIQEKYKLEVLYSSSPQDLLSDKNKCPDLVIGEELSSPFVMRKFESLEKLLLSNWIHSDLFYKSSLGSCEFEKETKLLPISFTLPTVVFRKGTLKGLVASDTVITLDEIKKISLTSNEIRGEKLVRAGFMPSWNKEFLYDAASLYGSDFAWNSSGSLTWNKESFDSSCEFLVSWYKNLPGKPEMYDDFFTNYINKPYYQLVNKGDIFGYLTDSRAYFKIPPEKRKTLEIRWLSKDSKIIVCTDITYIGIPKQAEHKEGAGLFVRWLFAPETQVKLLEINHFKRLDSTYGIGGGFSTLKEITESYIPQHYPVFGGLVPHADSLVFPKIMPDRWKNFKKDVLFPWMLEKAMTGSTGSKLEDELRYFK